MLPLIKMRTAKFSFKSDHDRDRICSVGRILRIAPYFILTFLVVLAVLSAAIYFVEWSKTYNPVIANSGRSFSVLLPTILEKSLLPAVILEHEARKVIGLSVEPLLDLPGKRDTVVHISIRFPEVRKRDADDPVDLPVGPKPPLLRNPAHHGVYLPSKHPQAVRGHGPEKAFN